MILPFRNLVTRLPAPVALLAVLFWAAPRVFAQGSDDGLRKIDSPRFGICVRAPVAWNLVQWSRDDKAFVLSLPQEKGSPAGFVSCNLGLPPETLADFQKRSQGDDERERSLPTVRRKLVTNQLETIKDRRGDKPEGAAAQERLTTVWELDPDEGPKRFEVSSRLIQHDTLYTFTLATDEAHFAAYRADFDELLESAKFSPPEMGLKQLPGGYWLQSQFLFALRFPAAWKPAFGSSDKALLFARGAAHGLFADHLIVLASVAQPLDFNALRESVPAAVLRADPAARVESCQVVPQGAGKALETLIQTKQGDTEVTVLERRFLGERRNYEVRVSCESAVFKQQEAEIRKALDSFREVTEQAPADSL